MTGSVVQHTLYQHTKALGDFLPSGPIFQAAFNPDANLYKFLSGLAVVAQNTENLIHSYQDEFFPDTTNIYLDEWESALGIPDGCFLGTGTASERQRDIVCKILSRGARTLDDIQEIATKFGITISVRKNPISIWPYAWPIAWESAKVNRNTLYVSLTGAPVTGAWPISWPHAWGGVESVIKCLIEKIVSANTKVVFE